MMRHSAAALVIASSVVLTAPVCAAAQAAPVPTEHQFQDWVAGCDNTRACVAVGLVAEDGLEIGFVQVERAGGGQSAPVVRLTLYDDTLAPGQSMVVSVDGAPIEGVASPRPVVAVADFEGYWQTTLAPWEVAPFVEALRRGSRLELANPNGETAAVSLRGAMAALLLVDDVQGRVGTVTAMARPGSRSASAIPQPPSVPAVSPRAAAIGTEADPALAGRLRARWAKESPEHCESYDEAAFNMDDVSPLDAGRSLVAVVCSAGAYNYEVVFAVVPGSDVARAQPARFPLPAVDGQAAAEVVDRLVNGGFDAANGRVAFFNKGRGLGDCGSSGEYAWTGDGFALVSWRVMPDCRGVPEAFWPVLWRTETP